MSGSRARAAAAAGPDKKLPPGSAGPLGRLRGRRGSTDAPPRQPWTESELLALETVRPEHVLGLCRVTESECGPVPERRGLCGPGRAGPLAWGAAGPGPFRRCRRGTRRLGLAGRGGSVQLPESLGAFVLSVGFDLFEAFCYFAGLLISAFLSRSHPFLALLPGTYHAFVSHILNFVLLS